MEDDERGVSSALRSVRNSARAVPRPSLDTCPLLRSHAALLAPVATVVAAEAVFVAGSPFAELWQEMSQVEKLQCQVCAFLFWGARCRGSSSTSWQLLATEQDLEPAVDQLCDLLTSRRTGTSCSGAWLVLW